MRNSLPETCALDLELADGWLNVWFNEPKRRNPLTAERVSDLVSLCNSIRDRRDIRGVTFRGRGACFCAGGDLKGFSEAFGSKDSRTQLQDLSIEGAAVFDAIDQLPQFTIMAIEGGAMAGGLGLACCGDLVLAAEDTKFALSEIRLGIIPAQITPFVVRRIGRANCRKLMLMANVVDVETAMKIGIVDEVVPTTNELDERCASVISLVGRTAPRALATTKALINDIHGLDRDEQINRAAKDFADALVSDEGREGVSAFLQKRKPDWQEGKV